MAGCCYSAVVTLREAQQAARAPGRALAPSLGFWGPKLSMCVRRGLCVLLSQREGVFPASGPNQTRLLAKRAVWWPLWQSPSSCLPSCAISSVTPTESERFPEGHFSFGPVRPLCCAVPPSSPSSGLSRVGHLPALLTLPFSHRCLGSSGLLTGQWLPAGSVNLGRQRREAAQRGATGS